jgi:ribonuclease-3
MSGTRSKKTAAPAASQKKKTTALKRRRRTAPAALQKKIGYTFDDKSLLVTALTHPTYANNVEPVENNQRMEFLGDAVLGLLTAEYAYRAMPDANEGALTLLRSRTVSGAALAKLGAKIGIGKCLFTDGGGDDEHLRAAEHTLACAVEAVVGAVWLDGGIESARAVFEKLFEPTIDALASGSLANDPKGALQTFAHRNTRLGEPVYTLVSREGPDHEPVFRVRVRFGALEAEGSGSRRKAAEAAAAAAWLAEYGQD